MSSTHKAERMIAVMLATKQYTGTANEDEDVWQESLSEDDQDDYMETARDVVAAMITEGWTA